MELEEVQYILMENLNFNLMMHSFAKIILHKMEDVYLSVIIP